MRRAEAANYSLESIDRMALILTTLESAAELSLDQVARMSGLNESTALRYLLSLAKHGLVERDDTSGRFRLGLVLFRLGTRSIEFRDIIPLSLPVMEQLLARYGESVNLATRQHNQVVLLKVLESPSPTRKGAKAGEPDVWHGSSLGKAMLATLPAHEVTQLVGEGPLPSLTPNTIVSVVELQRDLNRTRERGYAVDDEESVEGLRCIGVCIHDHADVPRYAISVSGPKSRMTYQRTEEIGATLITAGRNLSLALGGVPR